VVAVEHHHQGGATGGSEGRAHQGPEQPESGDGDGEGAGGGAAAGDGEWGGKKRLLIEPEALTTCSP
jgi:hypothetical protein